MILQPSQLKRGFTLIEIMVVVVILGIAAAIVVPQIGGRDDLKLAAAARVLLADLAYAQNQAIVTQRKQYLKVVDQQYFILSRSSDADTLAQIDHPVLPGKYAVTLNAGRFNGVKLATVNFGGKTIVGFDSLGSPLSYDTSANTSAPLTSTGTIKLTSGSAEMTIAIEPYTGETSVSSN